MENLCRAAYFRVNVSTACARFSDLARMALSQSLPPAWKKRPVLQQLQVKDGLARNCCESAIV